VAGVFKLEAWFDCNGRVCFDLALSVRCWLAVSYLTWRAFYLMDLL